MYNHVTGEKKISLKKLYEISVLACIIISISATVAWPSPRLTLPETVFNFGYVPQHSLVSHRFWLLSTGDDTLRIERIIPGCSCTRAPLKKNKLASGDSTVVEIIFSTKSFRNRVEKSPKIQTNEDTPNKSLKIIANVLAKTDSTFPVIIEPFKISLHMSETEQVNEKRFSIKNVSKEDLKLELISVPDGYFEIDLPVEIKAGETKTGEIRLLKDSIEKVFQKSFTIRLNDDFGSRFTIPVKRTIDYSGN